MKKTKVIITIEDYVITKVQANSACEVIIHETISENAFKEIHTAEVCDIELANQAANLESAKHLWGILGDIPVNDDGELEEDIELMETLFTKGTDREDIWDWFEETFNISVGEEFFS